MNFDGDLFSNNNIVVPRIQVISSTSIPKKRETQPSVSNVVQNELFVLDSTVVSEQQLKVTKRFYDTKRGQKYKKTNLYHDNVIKTWHKKLLNKIKASVTSKNRRNNTNYLKDLARYHEYIKYGLPAIEPVKPEFFPYPDFDADFLKNLWDLQEGRDAYTNHEMIISSVLAPFSPSGDRVSSKLPYTKGNMVLCCYSTNMGKNEFEIYEDNLNSWINYHTFGDPIKKQEIHERVARIRELSLLL